jgi:hypothetical protein
VTTLVPNALLAPFDATPVAYRNRLINGNFDIWQRGTTWTNPTAQHVADRWRLEQVSSAGTVSQQTFTAGQTEVPGNPAYFLRLAQTGTGLYRVAQRIEAPGAFSGQQVTLTFWAKTPSAGALASVYFSQDAFASGARTDTLIVSSVALTTSWQKFTYTGTFPSATGKTVNASTYAGVEFYLPSGTASTVDLAQVQLELGPAPTAFETRPPALELALAQRYYQQLGGRLSTEVAATGWSLSTTSAVFVLPLKATMRATPTVSMSATTDWLAGSASVSATIASFTYGYSSPDVVEIDATPTGTPAWTANASLVLRANSTNNARIKFDAEI